MSIFIHVYPLYLFSLQTMYMFEQVSFKLNILSCIKYGSMSIIDLRTNVQVSGMAKSHKCVLVHGQVVLRKHLSVPKHNLSVLLQTQMQLFKKWFNKQNYDYTATFM